MPKKIFISFASKDRQTAMTICHALEARGQQCWISCRDIHPGENYQESIVRAIRGAGVMLLVFSANANNSDEIKKEIALASQSRLMVIPVRSEDVVPSEAFSYELATRQWVDLFENWDQAMAELVAQLDSINPTGPAPGNVSGNASGETPLGDTPPRPAPAPICKLPPAPPPASRKHWAIIAALVLLALAIIVFVPMLSGLILFGALIYAVIHYRNQAKAARALV
jgi:hypothetical protein